MEEFINIWYIDEPLVNSLYNQSFDNVVNITKVRTANKSFASKLSLMLSKFRLLNADADVGFNFEKGVSIEEKIQPSVELKIKHLLMKSGGESAVLSDVLEGFTGNSKLVFVSGYFALEELYYITNPNYNVVHKIRNIKNANELIWHLKFLPGYIMPVELLEKQCDIIARHYNLYEVKLNTKDYNVDLFADGKNVKVGVKHLTKQIEYRRPFWFQVYGWLEYLGDRCFSIKPIVILK